MNATHVLVIAKSPLPGRVKTRLCPPCTPVEAAELAAAALGDTLAAVAALDVRHVLALDGPTGEWLPSGFEVIAQRGDGLAERLANAWSDADGPGLQIGMDTPQVTPTLLEDALVELHRPGIDAVLGAATDGGWWAIGLRRPDPRVFAGVPMSDASTGARQRAQLQRLGRRVGDLTVLNDVDTIDDAIDVAAMAPMSRFARTLASQLAVSR